MPGYNTDNITATLELDYEASLNEDGTYGGCVLDPNYDRIQGMSLGCVYEMVEENNPYLH